MGMGTIGIPWVPLISYGNGSDNDYHGRGTGTGNKTMGIELWEWV